MNEIFDFENKIILDVAEETFEDDELQKIYWQLKGEGISPAEILEKWIQENND